MKSALLILVAMATTLSVLGQGGGKPPASPHDTVSNANATVTYGRPYKKGRDVFGGLEKFGTVWRLGANKATTITFNKKVNVGGTEVPAGTYTLFALVNENEWTFILNGQLNQWGAYEYEKHKDKDVAKATVPVIKQDKVVEQLTISFAPDNSLVVEWDTTKVVLPLTY